MVAAYLKLHSSGLLGCIGKTRSLLQILQLSLLKSTLCPLPPLFSNLSLWEYFLFFSIFPQFLKAPCSFSHLFFHMIKIRKAAVIGVWID